MEVGVRVEAERMESGKIEHVGSAYLTMVAMDAQGRPTPVPPLRPGTITEKRRYTEAKQRRIGQLALVGRCSCEDK
jgi:acyl-CoA hydrolase